MSFDVLSIVLSGARLITRASSPLVMSDMQMSTWKVTMLLMYPCDVGADNDDEQHHDGGGHDSDDDDDGGGHK